MRARDASDRAEKEGTGRGRSCINFDARTERERRREFDPVNSCFADGAHPAYPVAACSTTLDRTATRLFNRCIMQIDITAPLRMQ